MQHMELATIFSEHTVFQAHKPILVYGTGRGDAEVTFDGETKKLCSDSDFWCISFPSHEYGGPYGLKVCLNGKTQIYNDIYVGEVLLLAGQSNIAFRLGNSTYPKEKYEDNPLLRYYTSRRFDKEDVFTQEDGWVLCNKQNAENFSALGYHLGMELSGKKGIAVGLIACYYGSSVIDRFYLPKEEKYDSPYVHGKHNEYGTLYNVRQQSIVPFSVGRVIWYQGESNTGSGEWKNYTSLLSELIKCWRRDFKDEGLPFTVIQISNFDKRKDDGWKGIQLAQERIAEVTDNVTIVKSCDVCESFDIHPPTKINLARRIIDTL